MRRWAGHLALLAFALGAAASVAGCKGKGAPETGDAGDHRTSASLTDEQQGKVLARVGDTTITLGDYVAALEHMDQFDRLRYQDPKRRTELLNEMIVTKLLAQEAREKGYDKDPRVQEELRAVLRDAMLKDARKGAPTPADIPAADVRAYYDAHRASYRDPERRRVSAIVLPTAALAETVLEQVKKGVTAAQWGELVRSKSVDPSAKAAVPVDLAGDL
ncbi:MAG TPA: peptidyl-prolyl cis-trans isomerase, partial [Polyangiaceae bacterium]